MGVEQYVYAEIGFPGLEVVGEIAGELNRHDKPRWINQATHVSSPPRAVNGMVKRTPKLLIYGGCILRPIHGYVEAELDACEAIYDVPSMTYLPVSNIAGLWKYTDEQRKEWIENVSLMNPDAYDQRLADGNLDYLLISLGSELKFWQYTRNDDSAVRFYTPKLTAQTAKSGILVNFTGAQTTGDDLLDELRDIADHLRGRLVILTLPDYKKPNMGEDAEYLLRIKLNKIAETLAAEKQNVILLDMRKYMKSHADSLDGSVEHYNRQAGFKIAMELLERMGVREKKEAIKIAPPKNAVTVKSAIKPALTGDIPEYVAYIRNGYYYVDIRIANCDRYEFKYICFLNRKLIEETGYEPDPEYKRALTQIGGYWTTISVREKKNPSKEYRFNTARILYTEYNAVDYIDISLPDAEDHVRSMPLFFMRYPIDADYRRRWTQQLFFLKSHGVTIVDYFERHGITNVSLFSNTDIYPIILQSLEGVGFSPRYLFTDDQIDSIIPEVGFTSRYPLTEWAGNYVGPRDTILIAQLDWGPWRGDAAQRIKAAKAAPVKIMPVLNELITDVLFNKMLPDMLKAKGIDIPIIVFQTPNSIQNFITLSPSDKQVAVFSSTAVLKAKKENLNTLPGIWKDVPLEEMKETLKRPAHYRLPNGIMSMRDVSGKYLNIRNGRRKTVGQPKTYKGTLYMFGHHGLFGYGVKDEDTIASRLQAIMPAHRVENCSNYWIYNDWEDNMLGALLKSIDFKQGDAICIQCQMHHSDNHTLRLEAIRPPLVRVNCDEPFKTPSQPDLFLSAYSSLAPWGNQKVAEMLKDALCSRSAKSMESGGGYLWRTVGGVATPLPGIAATL